LRAKLKWSERPKWNPESYETIVEPAAKAARAGH